MCCSCNIITILWWHNHTRLMHKLQTFGIIKDFSDHQKLSRLSRNFQDHPDTFQIIQKPSRPSKNFLDFLETFQVLLRFSKLSEKYPDHPETFQSIRKFSRLSWNFRDYSETFQIIRKLPRPSGHFPDNPETFQTIRKLSRPSGNLCIWACLLMVDFIDTRKNFPDAQKLSRWQCHHETWVFLTLVGM